MANKRTRRQQFAALILLATLPFCAAAQQKSPGSPAAANGKTVYVRYCLTCHQADGGGVQNMNPPLVKSSYVSGDKKRLIGIILKGFGENVEIGGETYTNKMPSFAMLSDKDIADLLTYVRSHFSNHASPIKPAEVASLRSAGQ